MSVYFQEQKILFGCQGESTLVTLVICHRGQDDCTGSLATDIFMSRFSRDVTAETSTVCLFVDIRTSRVCGLDSRYLLGAAKGLLIHKQAFSWEINLYEFLGKTEMLSSFQMSESLQRKTHRPNMYSARKINHSCGFKIMTYYNIDYLQQGILQVWLGFKSVEMLRKVTFIMLCDGDSFLYKQVAQIYLPFENCML